MKLSYMAVLTAALVLSACASTPKVASTPSGRPEAYFAEQPANVVGRLSSACLDGGLIVYESGPSHVICGKTMTGFKGALTQALLGNSYSTTPELRARFQAVSVPTGTRVQVMQWVETQMAFGQMQRQELNGGQAFNDAMNLLWRMGGTSGPSAAASPIVEPETGASPPPIIQPTPRKVTIQRAETPSGYCLFVPEGMAYPDDIGPPTKARPLCQPQ
jgi:hypothetical protein